MIPISEVLEDAARVCDAEGNQAAEDHDLAQAMLCLDLASSIRALAAKYEGHVVAINEPDAWMHPDGRVVTADTMRGALRDGGAMLTSLRPYTIPLYRAKEPTK